MDGTELLAHSCRFVLALVFGTAGGAKLANTAQADSPSRDGDVDPQACAVYCYMINCPCPTNQAATEFRCISQCGWEQTTCYQRSCVGFCLSQHAC